MSARSFEFEKLCHIKGRKSPARLTVTVTFSGPRTSFELIEKNFPPGAPKNFFELFELEDEDAEELMLQIESLIEEES